MSDVQLDELIKQSISDYENLLLSAQKGTVLLDQFGANRIARYLNPGAQFVVSFRDAVPEDLGTYFLWVNSPSVQFSSGRTTQIEPDEHLAWFSEALASGETHMTVLCVNGVPAGQCRIERKLKDKHFTIDYSVDAGYRRLGLATKLVEASLGRHRRTDGETMYVAEVRAENRASQKVLGEVGFSASGTDGTMLRFERIENQN
jgi:RimJ/RimL family protein N-acetyltransferase